jgi:hypothetical protein
MKKGSAVLPQRLDYSKKFEKSRPKIVKPGLRRVLQG